MDELMAREPNQAAEALAARARESREIAASDRSDALVGMLDAAEDMLTYGLDNFWGICIGGAIVVGGLWLAVATSTG